MENQDFTNFQQTSSQMPKALVGVLNSVLTQTKPSMNSETGQPPKNHVITTGRPLSVISSVEWLNKNLERIAETSQDAYEQAVVAKLKLLPSLRMNIKTSGKYGSEGYLGETRQVTILACSDEDRQSYLDWLKNMLRPAKEETIVLELQRLKYKTASRANEDDDWKMKLAVYTDDLRVYPEHAVKFACNELANKTFFPVLNELKKLCEDRVSFLKDMERAVTNYQDAARIEHTAHYRDIPKEKWTASHYLQKVQELVQIADIQAKHNMHSDELGMLLAAQRFIADARAKYSDDTPDIGLIYKISSEITPRIEILEKRLTGEQQAVAKANS